MLYYLINSAILSGGNSGDIILTDSNKIYEMKSAELKKGKKFVGGFFTGRAT